MVRVESLAGSAGDPIEFENILMIGDGESSRVGNPTVEGARVKGTVVDQGRAKKILIYTYKRRKNSNRKQAGHRQNYTEVKIEAIEA